MLNINDILKYFAHKLVSHKNLFSKENLSLALFTEIRIQIFFWTDQSKNPEDANKSDTLKIVN